MLTHIQQNPYLIMAGYMREDQAQINESLARLSSGLRVTSPADDQGAYFIASSLERKMGEVNNLIPTLDEYIGALNTAKSSLEEIKDLLEDASDLALAASTEDDLNVRGTLADDWEEIMTSVQTIVDNSSFNGKNMLSPTGSFSLLIDESTSYSFSLLDTDASEINGLHLGADVAYGGNYVTDPSIDWRIVATGKDSASKAYQTVNGTRWSAAPPATDSTAGIARVDRNISRVSTVLSILEGRKTLLQTKATNYEAVRSSLVDVNQAEETTKLTTTQIKQQASAYFLAQANSSNTSIIKLLSGFTT
ncbi:flagellin [Fibrobacterota bacterium]